MPVIRPASIVNSIGSAHVPLEREQDVARRDDDAAVDAVVLAAGDHHAARRPVIPPARLVDEPVLGLDGVADAIGHVGPGRFVKRREVAPLSNSDATSVRRRRSSVGNSRARRSTGSMQVRMRVPALLDLRQLRGEEEEQRLDHHVGAP